jgi:cobalt-zinc-cadmium efflux system outer membrane protein
LVAAQAPISEAEAVARLSAESPHVRAIMAAVDVARAEALAQGRWPNPRLTFTRESVAGVTEQMFLVAQPVPLWGRRGLDARAASALVAASQHRAQASLRHARAELRRAFADLLSAQVREAELAASRDRLRSLAEILAHRERAGDSAGFDRLRAEREVIEVEADLAASRADQTRAQGALASFFAASTDPSALIVRVPVAGGAAVPVPSVAQLLAHAGATLPDRAALESELESADVARQAAHRRLIPEPEFVAGTKSSNVAGGDLGGVFGVQASIPLFDRATPERALASARRTHAEARLAALDAARHAEVTALRALVVERRRAADTYRATASSAAELEHIARVSYDAGERGILELLDAYRATGAVKTRQALLDAAARHAEIDLELVSGWEIRQ